jgi:hypothetical protein
MVNNDAISLLRISPVMTFCVDFRARYLVQKRILAIIVYTRASGKFVHFYQTTRRHIQEDRLLVASARTSIATRT